MTLQLKVRDRALQTPLRVFFFEQCLSCCLNWTSLHSHDPEVCRIVCIIMYRGGASGRRSCLSIFPRLVHSTDLELHLLLLFQSVCHVGRCRCCICLHRAVRVKGVSVANHLVLTNWMRLPSPLWGDLKRALPDRTSRVEHIGRTILAMVVRLA